LSVVFVGLCIGGITFGSIQWKAEARGATMMFVRNPSAAVFNLFERCFSGMVLAKGDRLTRSIINI
jgi:hypothetical protein